MNRITNLSFCGGSTESTGSPAYSRNVTSEVSQPENLLTQPTVDTVNFRGKDSKKKHTGLKIILGTVGLAAVSIGGLAYVHKANLISKLNDGWLKNVAEKIKPASKKCYEWCSTLKTKCAECWNKIKNMFGKD